VVWSCPPYAPRYLTGGYCRLHALPASLVAACGVRAFAVWARRWSSLPRGLHGRSRSVCARRALVCLAASCLGMLAPAVGPCAACYRGGGCSVGNVAQWRWPGAGHVALLWFLLAVVLLGLAGVAPLCWPLTFGPMPLSLDARVPGCPGVRALQGGRSPVSSPRPAPAVCGLHGAPFFSGQRCPVGALRPRPGSWWLEKHVLPRGAWPVPSAAACSRAACVRAGPCAAPLCATLGGFFSPCLPSIFVASLLPVCFVSCFVLIAFSKFVFVGQ
jgi:hypothetical protein